MKKFNIYNETDKKLTKEMFYMKRILKHALKHENLKKVYFNDKNPVAVKIIKSNLEKFGVMDKADVIKKDYEDAIEYYRVNRIKFNIIFLDPPYDNHVITQILKLIYRKKLLKKGGIVICEYQNEDISTEYFTVERKRVYGYRKVSIYTEKK